jgi:hypothetical protein
MERYCTIVLLMLLIGCGTTSRVVRLEMGQTDTIVFTPRSGSASVKLDDNEFEEIVSELARDVRLPTRFQEAARQLFEMDARSGSYTYETSSRRITPLKSGENPGTGESTAAELELTRAYLQWCERTGKSGDCLRLLTMKRGKRAASIATKS